MKRKFSRFTGILTAAAVVLSCAPAAFARDAQKAQQDALPSSFDLRDYGLTAPNVNQVVDGPCWAVATTNNIESALVQQFPGRNLSYEQLILATYNRDEIYDMERYFLDSAIRPTNEVDIGGNSAFAIGALAAWRSPVFSETFSLSQDSNGTLLPEFHLQDAVLYQEGMVGLDNHLNVTGGEAVISADTIKRMLMENRTIVVSCNVSDDNYNLNGSIYCPENIAANHSVLIIGWDDNYPRENFSEGQRPENDGAWLLKNSYTLSDGDSGYCWLSYEDKSSTICSSVSFEPADNYANIYQYDYVGWTGSNEADRFVDPEKASKTGYMSNIFTAQGSEQLEAVSFYTTENGAEYEIYVYTGAEKGQPSSGTLVHTQSGSEVFSGYHTIELNKAIALGEGENFSIVVKLTNPRYAYPIPIEYAYLNPDQTVPRYMGCGGESYISEDGESWSDVASLYSQSDYFNSYISNVCLKAFTNPLPESGEATPNVRFSLFEGEVPSGSRLTLSGGREIWYSIDGGEAVRYTRPIVLKKACTVSAWSVSNGKKGNTVTRSYTVASAQLSDLLVLSDSGYEQVTFADDHTAELEYSYNCSTVKLRPRSAGKIVVNGIAVPSDEFSREIPLRAGEENIITICTTGIGRVLTPYTLKIYRSPVKINDTGMTVSYDENKYTLTSPAGVTVENGGSISGYLGCEMLLCDKHGNVLRTVNMPERKTTVASTIDFANECTTLSYGDWNLIAYSPDMSDAQKWTGGKIPLEPGQTLYLRNTRYDSTIPYLPCKISVPERIAPPIAEVEEVYSCRIIMKDIEGAEYRIDGGEWQSDPCFETVKPDTLYNIEVRYPATDSRFASGCDSVSVKTKKGIALPIHYAYNGITWFESIYSLDVGENIIDDVEADDVLEYGFITEIPEETVTVNVTEENGVLTADAEHLTYEIRPNTDPGDYYYDLAYVDGDGKRITGGGLTPFGKVGELYLSDIPVPEGYKAVGSDDKALTEMFYLNGTWRVSKHFVTIELEKLQAE